MIIINGMPKSSRMLFLRITFNILNKSKFVNLCIIKYNLFIHRSVYNHEHTYTPSSNIGIAIGAT